MCAAHLSSLQHTWLACLLSLTPAMCLQMPGWTTTQLTTRCLTPMVVANLLNMHNYRCTCKIVYQIACLLASLGLPPSQIVRYILSTTPDQHFASARGFKDRLVYFIDELNMPRARVAHMLRKHPGAVCYNIEGKYRPLVRFFMSYWQTEDPATVARAFERAPRLLGVRTSGCLSRCVKCRLLCVQGCCVQAYRQCTLLCCARCAVHTHSSSQQLA